MPFQPPINCLDLIKAAVDQRVNPSNQQGSPKPDDCHDQPGNIKLYRGKRDQLVSFT